MRLITIEQARDHCKADGDDDNLLEIYATAAEAMCARLANRSLFASAAEYEAAMASVSPRMAAAYIAYDAAITAAKAADDARVSVMMAAQAQHALDAATLRCEYDMHGLVVPEAGEMGGMTGTEAIHAAILLLTAHYYMTLPAVITGQGAAAIEVPLATRDIMEHYRWTGPL